jgi:hypothetical protein
MIRTMMLLEQEGAQKATIHLGPYSHFMIVCALQLAWRHPEISDHIRDVWRQVGDQMIGQLQPEQRAMLERGWDVSQDRGWNE